MNDTINVICHIAQEGLANTMDAADTSILDILMLGRSWNVFFVVGILLLLSALSFRWWRKIQRIASYGLLFVLTVLCSF